MPSRVLLINANRYGWPYPVFPLGLAHVAAALHRAGHLTRWLDLLVEPEALPGAVAEFQPDVTGISLRNIDDVLIKTQATFFTDLADLCGRIRAAKPGPVVLGGSGFSIFPRELLALSGADFGIQGEGEESLVTLVEALASGADCRNIPGLVFRDQGEIRMNPPRRLPQAGAMDAPELPAALVDFYLQRSSMLNLQTQRGCACHCSYCTYPLIEGAFARRRAPAAVANNLEQIARRGAQYAFIVDSVFNSSPAHVTGVCEEILRRKLNLKWGCFLRPQGLTVELAKLMARAGLAHIEFGADSFCDPVLKALGKGLTFDDIQAASESASRAGIDYCHFLICGGPGETAATLDATFANSLRLPGGVIMAVVGVRLYPNTALARDHASAAGEISPADLLQPRYYLAPGLTREGVFAQLEDFARRNPNWIFGDPPASYLTMAERLRQRGVVGPLWSYFAIIQRLAPRPAPAAR